MEDLLTVAVEEGGFSSVEELKGSPIPQEQVLQQIKDSYDIKVPLFEKMPERTNSCIFIAGGSSLLDHLEEISDRYKNGEFILTSNMTHDFIVEQGIIPNVCIIVDPKERVKDYIKNPQKQTEYVIGTVCVPEVAQQLIDAGMNVKKILVGYGFADESDIKLQKELYPGPMNNYLVGGTMMGLRAMNMALLLGFSKIEYYGMDSCYSSKPALIQEDDTRYEEIVKSNNGRFYTDVDTGKNYTINGNGGGFFYAYKKERVPENIQIAKTSDGRKFLTSPCFAHQAKQFLYWVDRLEGKLEVVLHGDSLTSHLYELHRKQKEHAYKVIGDKRWTDEYAKLQEEMHLTQYYGYRGGENLELISRSVVFLFDKLRRPIEVLDYGCSDARLSVELYKLFNAINVRNYDPFNPVYSNEPDNQYDITTCCDVMEHVEEQCVENNIKYIADKTRLIAIFQICLVDAVKILSDGRNAHITQKSIQWWAKQISKYFNIGEAVYTAEYAYFVCQAMNADETINKELQKGTICTTLQNVSMR